VIQLPIALVLIPIAIYVFTVASTPAAVAFLVWSVLVSLIDNVLKPLLLGRGVQVPMLVIFVGTIGGFLAYGIIGLFVGSLVLAVGYVLIRGWIAEAPGEAGGFDAPSP
jgi:predicted PurR-regulated permease PerM